VPFKGEVATVTSTHAQRLRDVGGAVLAGQTTASEFGSVHWLSTPLHGTTAPSVATRPHTRRFIRWLGGGGGRGGPYATS
jgi:Asp-tRNA(Asn)/Glu-tRNA(Gln) amidotransferase A subunit family amidase